MLFSTARFMQNGVCDMHRSHHTLCASHDTSSSRHHVLAPLSILFLVSCLVGTSLLSSGFAFAATAHAKAARLATPPAATMTLSTFLSYGRADRYYHGPFHYPNNVGPVPGTQHDLELAATIAQCRACHDEGSERCAR